MFELKLEQWREALEERGVNVSRVTTECMCLESASPSLQSVTGHLSKISGKCLDVIKSTQYLI